jgi:hypothetical protein
MNPLSSGNSSFGTEWAVAMQAKVQDSAKEQGKAAVQLIEASSAQKAASGSVGTKLNVVA